MAVCLTLMDHARLGLPLPEEVDMPRRAVDDVVTHKDVSSKLIAFMAAAALALLGWIGANIHQMSATLAVAVSKIEDHDRRLSNLETLFLGRTSP